MTDSPAAFIGLMSGTSLDGISAAVARFPSKQDDAGATRAQLLAFVQRPYASAQRDRLRRALVAGSAEEYCRLGYDLGAWLADAAVAVLAEAGVAKSEVRAIGSHGQTIWHDPPRSTWQLGESAVIAERLGIDVVSDFRAADVAAGGQGAPLVPLADAVLFAGDRWLALQNVGGIGNVTIVPPNGAADGVRAFDTGPGVVVIDGVVRALFPGRTFDENGALGSQGSAIHGVVDQLLRHDYFKAAPPKSTGRELFDQAYVERLIEQCRRERPGCSGADVVATAVALTARSIADAYHRFVAEPISEVLVSGGGAKNGALMTALQQAIGSAVPVRSFSDVHFEGEAKEAVAFAFLAKRFLDGHPGNLPRVTGARHSLLLGKLTPGRQG